MHDLGPILIMRIVTKPRSDRRYQEANHLSAKAYAQYAHNKDMRVWRKNSPEKYRKIARRCGYKLKLDVLERYGGKLCSLCGESDDRALALDHVNNDGAYWRKITGMGKAFYQWLRARNWPSEPKLQVLCFNCNQAKRINGGVLPDNRRSAVPGIKMFALADYQPSVG